MTAQQDGAKAHHSGSRRKSREVALQVLYLLEFQQMSVDEALAHFWREGELDPKLVEFSKDLIAGTRENAEHIDNFIGESSEHWRLDRMALIDRNIMRMAVFEFLFTPKTPRKVVINEALEIAKRFSGQESTQFINGILDNIRLKLDGQDPQ